MEDLKNQYLAWDWNIYAALDQRVTTTALKTLFMFCHVLRLTGSAGVGKTRLAIEGIKKFLEFDLSFTAYCISDKNYTIYKDLSNYIVSNKNFILFIDDANRLFSFKDVMGQYKKLRQGKLKLVITSRNYALDDILSKTNQYSPSIIRIKNFPYNEIEDILKCDPFNIYETRVRHQLYKISAGNPRFAIMMARLYLEDKDVMALKNLSDLFESYFSTYVLDNKELSKEINIMCLGLISFFRALPYKNNAIMQPILKDFKIDYKEFIESISSLKDMEIVEIDFDYVKIGEQNLSSYFFYKSFLST